MASVRRRLSPGRACRQKEKSNWKNTTRFGKRKIGAGLHLGERSWGFGAIGF